MTETEIAPRAAWSTPSLALAVALSVFGGPADAEGARITGMAEIVDGDGLAIGPVIIRIHAIDAPEAGQDCATPDGGTWPCGQAAADRLSALTVGKPVVCEARDLDPYSRIVALCRINDVDIGQVLVEEGLAWAFVRYSADYVDLEATARAAAIGVWQAPTQAPWDYRADRWNRAAAEAPGGCPIKGNISRDGVRIYHTPWSPWYARTKISPTNGERWFCDEAEAQAAGWRAAESR